MSKLEKHWPLIIILVSDALGLFMIGKNLRLGTYTSGMVNGYIAFALVILQAPFLCIGLFRSIKAGSTPLVVFFLVHFLWTGFILNLLAFHDLNRMIYGTYRTEP